MGLRISDPNKDNQDEDQTQQQQAGGAAPQQIASGESANSGTAPGRQPGSLAARKPSLSGNFTDIGKYKAANEQGAKQFGANVGGKIDQQGAEVRQQIDGQTQTFNTGLNADTHRLGSIGTGIDENKANLSGVGSDFDNAFNSIQTGFGANYGGPTALENVGRLQEGAANVKDLATATKTNPGRLALLQRFYEAPDYSTGKQKLDSTLLGGQNFGGVLKNASRLNQDIGLATDDVSRKVIGANDQASQIKMQARGAAERGSGEITNTLSAAGRAYLAAEQARASGSDYRTPSTAASNKTNEVSVGRNNKTLNTDLGFQFSPEELMQLGAVKYTPNQGVNVFDNTDKNALAVGSRTDPDNINRTSNYNRLAALLGGESLATGGATLQQGQYDNSGLGSLGTDYDNEIQAILAGNHKGDMTYNDSLRDIQGVAEGGYYTAPGMFVYHKDQALAQANLEKIKTEIKEKALERLYNRRGIVGRGSGNPQGAV